MQFTDRATVLRAVGTDEYGNPRQSWDTPQRLEDVPCYFASPSKVFFPAGTDFEPGNRVVFTRVRRHDPTHWRNALFDAEDVKFIRTPHRGVLVSASLARIPGGYEAPPPTELTNWRAWHALSWSSTS